jgi:hypothetical protein
VQKGKRKKEKGKRKKEKGKRKKEKGKRKKEKGKKMIGEKKCYNLLATTCLFVFQIIPSILLSTIVKVLNTEDDDWSNYYSSFYLFFFFSFQFASIFLSIFLQLFSTFAPYIFKMIPECIKKSVVILLIASWLSLIITGILISFDPFHIDSYRRLFFAFIGTTTAYISAVLLSWPHLYFCRKIVSMSESIIQFIDVSNF